MYALLIVSGKIWLCWPVNFIHMGKGSGEQMLPSGRGATRYSLLPRPLESNCTSTRSSEVSLSPSGSGTAMEVTVGMTSCSFSGCSAVYVLITGIFL